ncbi:MAG: hypothetical protein AAFN07_12290 [Pseudomonadota bacterium]
MALPLSPVVRQCLAHAELYLPDLERQRLEAASSVMNAIYELREEHVSDEVRPAKSAWWDEELRRFSTGLARHPDTKLLAASGVNVESYPLLRQWLIAIRTHRSEAQLTATAFRIDAFRRFGTLLLLSTTDTHTDSTIHSATALACGLTAVESLSESPHGTDMDAGVETIRQQLTGASGHCNPGWRALANTLDFALRRLLQHQSVGSLGLMWHAWRGARKTPGP